MLNDNVVPQRSTLIVSMMGCFDVFGGFKTVPQCIGCGNCSETALLPSAMQWSGRRDHPISRHVIFFFRVT
jgi:hypothetical protein